MTTCTNHVWRIKCTYNCIIQVKNVIINQNKKYFILSMKINVLISLESHSHEETAIHFISIYFNLFQLFAGPNSCSFGNAGCSHICIPTPSNISKCLCPDGQSLAADNKSCTAGKGHNSRNMILFNIILKAETQIAWPSCKNLRLQWQIIKNIGLIKFWGNYCIKKTIARIHRAYSKGRSICDVFHFTSHRIMSVCIYHILLYHIISYCTISHQTVLYML